MTCCLARNLSIKFVVRNRVSGINCMINFRLGMCLHSACELGVEHHHYNCQDNLDTWYIFFVTYTTMMLG